MTSVLVFAKAPVPGRVKTRLCPPCTAREAAVVAEAALRDTLAAVIRVPRTDTILVLDGEPPPWLPREIHVIPQRGGDQAERLSAALVDVGGMCLLIGMDTPQVTSELLAHAIDVLLEPGVDAVLGPATDGGWWAAGLRRPHPGAFAGVPMSTRHTGALQLLRFRQLGLSTTALPELSDVDTYDDALAAAHLAPGSQFAATVSQISASVAAREASLTAIEMTG